MLRRAGAQDGFSLPELLVTLSIAMIVSLATFALIETVMRRSGEVTARVDAVQRGRAAMETITRELRSQVCAIDAGDATMTAPRSVYTGATTSITIFSDFADPSVKDDLVAPVVVPQRRIVSLDGTTIAERTSTGTEVKGFPGRYTYGAPRTRRVLDFAFLAVDPVTKQPIPFLRFYGYDYTKQPPTPTLALPTPLTPTTAAAVAKISISYVAAPTRGTADSRGATVFQNDVYVRSANPNSPNPKPTCV